ncbi:Kinesin-like protein KIF15, partial [Trichinella pseudospiralis]
LLLTCFANSKQFAAGKVTKMIQLEEDEELENSTVYAISILIVIAVVFTHIILPILIPYAVLRVLEKFNIISFDTRSAAVNSENLDLKLSFLCCALFSREMLENSPDFIKVIVRLRPLPNSGIPSLESCAEVKDNCHITLKTYAKAFTFDRIADETTTQESMFACVGKSIIDGCIEGYNGTIFAYGQTGSGKTYTMIGPCVSESSVVDDKLRGIIPRSLEYLFSRIEEITFLKFTLTNVRSHVYVVINLNVQFIG